MAAAVQPRTIFESRYLLKSRGAALDCRAKAYDIVNHIRPIPSGQGETI